MRLPITILLSSLLFTTVARSEMAEAKMAMRYPHKTAEIIQKLSAAKKDRPAIPQEEQLLELAILSEEVLLIKKIYSTSSEQASVSTQDILQQIKTELRGRSKWDSKLPVTAVKKLEARKDLLRNIFGEKTFEWAWVLNQLGQKQEAKNVLTNLFKNQHKTVMSLSDATFGFGGGPLSEIEPTYQALETLIEAKEKATFEGKMQDAKKHISTLPQSHILT